MTVQTRHASFEALVLAGGYGTRMNASRPKALIEPDGISLLALTLEGLIEADVRPILVVTDRSDWFSQTAQIVAGFGDTETMLSPRAVSTLEVAQAFASQLRDPFFFVYGHSPRPAQHYRKMVRSVAPIRASRTNASSKRQPIYSDSTGYLEPPYLLVPLLLGTCVTDWRSFFDQHHRLVEEIPLSGPSEFNEFSEYAVYCHYLKSAIDSIGVRDRAG